MQNLKLDKLQVSICNKCGKEVQKLSTQESIYQNNLMHTFNTDFRFCGYDNGIDENGCEFVLCQDCLFSIMDSFSVKPKYTTINYDKKKYRYSVEFESSDVDIEKIIYNMKHSINMYLKNHDAKNIKPQIDILYEEEEVDG